MTNFIDLEIINENLVQYFTGSYAMLGILILIIFFVILLGRGLDARYSLVMTLPLVGFFVLAGWFGEVTNNQWIVNIVLLLVAIIYGTVVVKIST